MSHEERLGWRGRCVHYRYKSDSLSRASKIYSAHTVASYQGTVSTYFEERSD